MTNYYVLKVRANDEVVMSLEVKADNLETALEEIKDFLNDVETCDDIYELICRTIVLKKLISNDFKVSKSMFTKNVTFIRVYVLD